MKGRGFLNYNRSSNYPCSSNAAYRNQQTSCGCNGMSQSMAANRSSDRNYGSSVRDTGCSCADDMNEQHTHNRFDKEPLAMAYVPWQHFGELYPPCKALHEGTIFPELNQIFCGVRG